METELKTLRRQQTAYLESFSLCAAIISLDAVGFLQFFDHSVRISAQFIHLFLGYAFNFIQLLQDMMTSYTLWNYKCLIAGDFNADLNIVNNGVVQINQFALI